MVVVLIIKQIPLRKVQMALKDIMVEKNNRKGFLMAFFALLPPYRVFTLTF